MKYQMKSVDFFKSNEKAVSVFATNGDFDLFVKVLLLNGIHILQI